MVRAGSPDELRGRLGGPPPEAPRGYDELLATLEHDVLPYVARISHPGYLAFIPGEGTWPAALADLIASALNVDTCWWLGASGPTTMELLVLDWFREWVGYPEGASGVLVSGGSAANLTALACAREAYAGELIYLSDQTHSSVARAARALGFSPDQVRVVPTGERGCIHVGALRSALAADRAAGRRPLALVANAGTTATGAVDPLRELADACHEHGVWFHVDGAYGAFACLTERGRAALDGLELADSIALDPHKWLYQPIEVGALLVRDGALLHRGFRIGAEYLERVEPAEREINFSDLGLQLTRSFRALKVWMSLQYFGVAAFRSAIDRCHDLAASAERAILDSTELELLSPASLGIVTFRRRPPGIDDEAALERINAALVDDIQAEGSVFLSSAWVRGRFALRLCILNHSTTEAEVNRALELAATLPVDTAPREAVAGYEPLEHGWLRRARLDPRSLCTVPLFASLDDAQAALVLRESHERRAAPGEPVVERWQLSRELYVVLEGAVQVTVDDEARRTLGPGEFFGEVAALDWGAGYGRTRTATVTAVEETRLLVLGWQLVHRLAQASPEVAGLLEHTAKVRLRPARA